LLPERWESVEAITRLQEENGDETGRKKKDVERERKRRKGDWRLGKGTGN